MNIKEHIKRLNIQFDLAFDDWQKRYELLETFPFLDNELRQQLIEEMFAFIELMQMIDNKINSLENE